MFWTLGNPPKKEKITCKCCSGKGTYYAFPIWVSCPACKGTGEVDDYENVWYVSPIKIK